MRKRLVRPIVSLVFVFSVAGFAYYEYWKSQKSEVTKENYFLTQELEELSKIKIKKEKTIISLSKKNNDWFLEKPIKDKASFTEVSRWFDEIKSQKVREISIEGDVEWKDYSIEKYPEVRLEFSEGNIISFLVSSKSSFDDKYFIKKDGKLLIGENYFFNEIHSKTFDSFRNKKIIPSYGHPTKVVLKNKRRALSFDWSNYRWSFKEKNFPLDEDRLDHFWSDLSSIEVLSIKERPTPFYLKKYGLDKKGKEIHLMYSHGGNKLKKSILKISPAQKGRIYVYGSHRDYILEISEEDAEKIEISKNDVRDHGQAFRYNKKEAFHLELKSKKISYSLEKKKNKWVSLSSLKKKIDSKKVQILLNSIHELKGQKYKKGKLKQTMSSIVIKKSSGEILLDLKASPSSNSMLWIQTNLSKDLVALPKSALDLIFEKDISFSNLKED